MVRLAVGPYSHFVVNDREARSPTVSYSIDTVQGIKHEFPNGTEVGFIIGLDAFLDFPGWKHATHLLEICQFIVCSRPGFTFVQLQSLSILPSVPKSDLHSLDQQQIQRLDIALPSGNFLTLLSVPPCEVSASQIRKHVALHRPIGHWLPPSVESYIIQHQVYQ